MLLSLEALRARHGDCLLLHYGATDAPGLILIDGGPARVYGTTLKPRLEQLRERRAAEDGVLHLPLAMLSHIDDDHIQGLLDLTGELIAADEAGQRPSVKVGTLWHNSFEDLTGDRDGGVSSVVEASAAERLSLSPEVPVGLREAAAVVASVGQGRQLRNAADLLGWSLNRPFDELVVAPQAEGRRIELDAETSLLVLAPNATRVERLRSEWEEQLRRLRRGDADEAEAAAYIDRSVFNLSSIVALAEAGERKVLLTGDARGDDILAGLEAAGQLADQRIELDILKLPHHGSDHNVERDFFERVRAKHYVLSGDGRHGNPETATLQMICEARSDDDFTLHFTYHEGIDGLGAKLDTFLAAQQQVGREFGVEFREDPALSLRIDLLDPLPD